MRNERNIKKRLLIVLNKHEKEEINELLKEKVFVWFEWKYKVNIIDINILNTSVNYEDKVYDSVVSLEPDIVISLWIEISSKFLRNEWTQLRFKWENKRFRWMKDYTLYAWRWLWYYKVRKTEDILVTHLRWILRANDESIDEKE